MRGDGRVITCGGVSISEATLITINEDSFFELSIARDVSTKRFINPILHTNAPISHVHPTALHMIQRLGDVQPYAWHRDFIALLKSSADLSLTVGRYRDVLDGLPSLWRVCIKLPLSCKHCCFRRRTLP